MNSTWIVVFIAVCYLMTNITCPDNRPFFDRFDGYCGGKRGMLFAVNTTGVRIEGTKLIVNGTWYSRADLNYPLILTMSIRRCKSKENVGSCENFQDLEVKKFCQILQSNIGLWSKTFNRVRPRWSCPVKKGVYILRNGEIDLAAILLFPAQDWFWKVRVGLKNGLSGVEIMCSFIEARLAV